MKKIDGVLLGASYYPERFAKSEWSKDAELMQKAGLRFIRTGEFAWSKFEPSDGIFDFAWMDEALEVFERFGLKVVMCTPTAAPMPWITARHPDIIPLTEEGKVFNPGERRHYCFNNLNYRYYTKRIVRKLAGHYSGNTSIIGWQVDNELGGEEFICCCDTCRKAFQKWLQNKYVTLEELNRRWGGTFFSFEFGDWSEIPVPTGHNVKFYNPSFKKDYLHFYSDSMKDYLYFQFGLIKEYIKDIPVTTNRFDIFWVDKFDHWMDEGLDVISIDEYGKEFVRSGFHRDFYSSIKKDKKHWVLEQCSGMREFGENQDYLMLQTVEAAAKGAELICCFSWRQINYGVEQDFYGIVNYDGTPGEAYPVLKKAADWLNGEGSVLSGLKTKNEAAILHSFDAVTTYYTAHAWSHVSYHEELYRNYYTPMFEMGIGVDFIRSFKEIFKYKLVVVPLYITEDTEGIEQLEAFVKSGGTVVITGDFMQKTKDSWRVYGKTIEKLNAFLGIQHKKIVGIQGKAYAGIGTGENVPEIVSFLSQKAYKIHGFFNQFDIVDRNIDILASVSLPAIEAGKPAAIERKLGKGSILFSATLAEKEFIKEIIFRAAKMQGMDIIDLPSGVELIKLYEETGPGISYMILNNSGRDISLELGKPGEHIMVEQGAFKLISR